MNDERTDPGRIEPAPGEGADAWAYASAALLVVIGIMIGLIVGGAL